MLRHLDSILAVLPDYLFELTRDGIYLDVHTPQGAPYSPQTHSPPGGIIGKSIYEVVAQEGADLAIAAFSKALETHQLVTEKWSRTFPDGAVRHYEARVVDTPDGTCIAHIRDVTDDRERAESLQVLLRELQRSNEYLQRFAFMASHDLQEPLRGMHGPAQVLLEELGPLIPPEHHRWLEHIHRNAVRAQTMVRDMLQFSRAATGLAEPELFESQEAITDVVDSFKVTIQERKATLIVDPDLPFLYYDRVRFRGILGNLLSNALKYAKPDVLPQVTISGGRTPKGVRFSVQDNGIGIAKEYFERITEPGFRLHHQDVPGNGLGLSSVAMILERCGGSLEIQSEVNVGSTFTITLPDAVPEGDPTSGRHLIIH